ncbi:MAG: hypothetical protein U0K59_03930 [Bacteroidales bacterium]|nr:hypothetical protein [Bacteroidales bacterium]
MATKQTNVKEIKNPINLTNTVVNPNIPNWQFNGVLPYYQYLNIDKSLKEKEYVVELKPFVSNKDFFENFLGIKQGAKALAGAEEFVRLVNNGICSQITTAVTDYFRKTKYNYEKYFSALQNAIAEIVTMDKLSSTRRDATILDNVRLILHKFIAENGDFYSKMYGLVDYYNDYNTSKLIGKNFTTKWYDWIPVLGVPIGATVKGIKSELQDSAYKDDYNTISQQNRALYDTLPRNLKFADYLSFIGVPQNDIATHAEEEAQARANANSGGKKTTTNSNISPILIGAVILVAVIIFKKMKK